MCATDAREACREHCLTAAYVVVGLAPNQDDCANSPRRSARPQVLKPSAMPTTTNQGRSPGGARRVLATRRSARVTQITRVGIRQATACVLATSSSWTHAGGIPRPLHKVAPW